MNIYQDLNREQRTEYYSIKKNEGFRAAQDFAYECVSAKQGIKEERG